MKKSLFVAFLLATSIEAYAVPVNWQLVDFKFNDGGSAIGSFTYDSDIDLLSNINITTTAGSLLGGRNFFATAGVWGSMPEAGVLAFSDTLGPDFLGAGWFRIDARIDFNASAGTIVNQWLAVGAESFCMNAVCSSAANEITHPGRSRDTVSGYLMAGTQVPEPSSLLLGLTALALLATRNSPASREG